MHYFADSYALVSLALGNIKYKKYFEENETITTKMNLLELYYSVNRLGFPEIAEKVFNAFLSKTVEIEDEILKKAAIFRLEHKKQNISYIDAIGYEIAKSKSVKFLTGDKEFKGMPNVEFVK